MLRARWRNIGNHRRRAPRSPRNWVKWEAVSKACNWISLENLGFPAGLQGLNCTWSLMRGKAVEFPSCRDAKAQSVLERTWDKDSPPMLALIPGNLPKVFGSTSSLHNVWISATVLCAHQVKCRQLCCINEVLALDLGEYTVTKIWLTKCNLSPEPACWCEKLTVWIRGFSGVSLWFN